ncbi:uncharacterized protein LOC120125061 [Hibiscus syriacus]|uniref:uncharacterized protein LOC120125061 n=1 Tax=Hibiscus syriacus TaxID=106335 RepID=UPI0019224D7F|nr:uncharacterized protein LOC120125061 [Hibiscus syriacus]
MWKEIAKLQGTELCMSSAYHPQTDGQIEALNRCLAGDEPSKWEVYLAWAEYWYNTAYQLSVGMTPFKALYGRDPPTIVDYLEGQPQKQITTLPLVLGTGDGSEEQEDMNLEDKVPSLGEVMLRKEESRHEHGKAQQSAVTMQAADEKKESE